MFYCNNSRDNLPSIPAAVVPEAPAGVVYVKSADQFSTRLNHMFVSTKYPPHETGTRKGTH
jgi:hypothetical protein